MLNRWNRRMYALICKKEQTVIGAIANSDVQRYEWLVANLAQANTQSYQDEYNRFWQMNSFKGLSSQFYQTYFNFLDPAKPMPSLRRVCEALYQIPRAQGDQALQFSFATKLRHMLNRELPIYDGRVASFYLFGEPSIKIPLPQRINGFIVFNNALKREYRRVLITGVLAQPIEGFKKRFSNPPLHTDVKIIDWLIYAFVQLWGSGKISW